RIGCANVTPSTVEKAVTALAEMRRVDPWKDAILRLPVWDGQKRLQSVFQDVFDAEPSPILENVSCAFFAGLVMRQLKPGISAPVIPVLIGRQ
ncbi:VapE domain-containing protein, partial [Glaesserella parasuis]